MLSFWESETFLHYDTIIIGSGIVGLSAALSLKEKSPRQSVLVLERGLFPSGASTRNAGFACFGSLTEILSDLKRSGPGPTLAVIEKRIRGLVRLRERLPDAAMDYQPVGGYELIFDQEMSALQHLEQANHLLRDLFPQGVYSERLDLLRSFGFNRERVRSLVHNPHEGHLHSGKLMQSLLRLAQEKGVEIRTGAEVVAIEDGDAWVRVDVKELSRGRLSFRAETVAVCTNAFTRTLLPDICITPGRGQVILTKPITNLPFAGAFHFDEGYYYFRNVGNRILFGGGRNLAFEAETSTEFQPNSQILTALERLLREIILPGQPVEIAQHWSGIMGFSEDKQPILKKLSPRLVIGFACNGMGVSLASTIGDEIAELIMNNDE
jgi:glycine/D-amino acid oxidase-like deaminating enzyme